MLTGNWLELHSNAEFAKKTRFGQRVVQGSLVFSIVNAMFPFDSGLVEAFYGVDRLRFIAPTFIGDTLHARREIIRLKDRDDTAGVVTALLEGINQRDEKVMSCEFSLLIRKVRRQQVAQAS
jgi:acyl dehydratase